MKPLADYKNKMTFPQKRDFDTFYLYKHGKVLVDNGTLSDIAQTIMYAEKVASGEALVLADKYHYVIEKAHDNEKHNAAVNAFRLEDDRLRNEFRDDLFNECGVATEAARFVMFDYAWNEGHSAGMSEVMGLFGEVVELIEKVDGARKEAREDR